MTNKPLAPMHSLFGWSTLGLILLLLTQPTFAQSFAGGAGTQGDPYQIENWNHLNNIRNHMSSDFVLNNDLTPDTAGYTTHVKNGATLANSGQGWDPIGECVFVGLNFNCTDFTGTLDGQSHAIVALEIARTTNEIGLFGRIGGAGTVKDLTLNELSISGGQDTGGLAGVSGGEITRVTVDGAVNGSNGATGGAVGNHFGTLSRVGFYGSVQGEDSTGGLVGFNSGSVQLSWARVQVSSNSIRVGGAVGNNQGPLDRVATSGQVTGLDLVGGLAGQTFRSVSRSYSGAQVTATNGSAGGLIGQMGSTTAALTVSQSYATGSVSGNSDSRGLVGNAARAGGAAAFTISNSFWDVDASGFGSVGTDDVGAIGHTTTDMKTQTTFTNAGWDFTANTGDWLMVDTATYPIFQALAFAGGEGTSASPYQIADWEHLNNIRIKLDSHFVLSQDLDPFSAGYTTHVKNGATLANGGQGWAPIGKTINPFTGVLDGANRSMSDLIISRSAESQVGLFGATESGGRVVNLALLDVSVIGGFQTAALVGNARGGAGALSNLRITGQVTSNSGRIGCLVGENFAAITDAHAECAVAGNSSVGGLVGDNRATIERSSSAGSVSGSSFSVGGLLGMNGSPVQQSFSRSDVSGSFEVGGLVGFNFGAISNAYAVGDVTGTNQATTSGFIGANGENDPNNPNDPMPGGLISNSYSAGVVTGGTSAGGFVGTSVGSNLYSNNFFNSEVAGQSTATASSATALTTAQMKTQTTFTNASWNLTANTGVWSIEQGTYLSYPYLQAISYDSPDTSPDTQPIPGLVQPPGAPTSVSATATNAQATVAWTAPADSGDSAVTGYTVTSSPDAQTCTTNGATSCIVTGLTNGTSYTFTVRATSSVGTGPASAPSTAVTPATVPGTPTITSVNGGNGQASIVFNAPVSDGGAAITGYTATSNPGGLTGSCSASPCVVTGLVNGTTYTFTLTATNPVGTGQVSTPSNAVTPAATVPGTPTITSVTGGNEQVSIEFSAPVSNGGAVITGYTATSNPGGLTGSCSASPCVVTDLVNGIDYTFTLTATNQAGTGQVSAPSTAVTPATVPGTPTITSVTGGNEQVSIVFNAPVSDGGAAITGYTATSNPGGLTGSCSASPCVVTDLVNGIEYTFTLTATNQAGTGAPSSPSSAVTPKTTPAAPINVAASPGSGQARIQFDAGDNGGDAISNYEYSLDGGNTWTARVPAATTSPWIIEGLTNGTEYSVKIRAINSVGEGLASETVVVCPSSKVFKDRFQSPGGGPSGCL